MIIFEGKASVPAMAGREATLKGRRTKYDRGTERRGGHGFQSIS
jgi:hypothetical protein